MIDLDELEAQSAVLVRNGCGDSCVTSSDDVLELITRLRQAEKDVARYRWLRDEANKSITIGPAVAMVGCDGSVMMREHGVEFLVCSNELDAAVDEAMQCHK